MWNETCYAVFVCLALVVSLAACGSGGTPAPQPADPTPAPAPAGGDGDGEPNDEPGQATAISTGEISGVIDEGDADWYAVEVGDGEVLTATVTPDEGAQGLVVTLRRPDREEMWRKEGLAGGESASVTRVMGSTSGGRYYLVVAHGQGAYALDVSLAAQTDAGVDGDAGSEAAAAREIGPGAYAGRVGDLDAADWYAVEVGDWQVLGATVTPDEGAQGMMVTLRRPDREEMWRKEGLGGGESASVTRVMNGTSGGRYYVVVSHGQGQYGLEISLRSQDDAGSGGDAGGEAAGALVLEAGAPVSGRVEDLDERDWYQVAPTAGQTLRFAPQEGAQEMAVSVHGPDREELWREEGLAAGETETYTLSEAGEDVYYAQVAYGSGRYTIELE
jgi:hypothetical protein